MDKYLKANLDYWNELVPIHEKSAFYSVDEFKAGKSTLMPIEREELGDVSDEISAAPSVSLWDGHFVLGKTGSQSNRGRFFR